MSLTLTVIAYKGLPPATAMSARFDQQGGTVGRSTESTLVLPDPEKYISRQHAQIEFTQGGYRLIDTSSAGTFVERTQSLLQQNVMDLADGDRLKIGEYELQVSIQAAAHNAPGDFFPEFPEPASSQGAPAFPDSPFAFDEHPFEPAPISPPAPDFGASPASDAPSFIEQPDSSPFRESFTPPGIVSPKAPELPDFDLDDLLRDFEEPHAAPVDVSPHWEPPAEVVPPFPEGPMDVMPEAPASEPEPLLGPFSIPTPGRTQNEFPVEKPVVAEPAPPAAPAPPMIAAAVTPPDAKLLTHFLRGAGITDKSFLSAEDQGVAMENLGRLFRDMVEGMMTVLRARSELKSQFRVSVTTIRPVNNNPLKFTVNVEEAMKILLARHRPGFIDSVEAVREGYDDIMNHQLAMTAGIQASLSELLKRFNPERFEKTFEEGIVFQKRAKCWEAYSKAYPELVTQALENFFGDEFAEVYEQQMQVLRSSRNKN